MTIKVAVCGLWHLGVVTAACVADHFPVVAFDPDAAKLNDLKQGRLPVAEPGLEQLLIKNIRAEKLSFAEELSKAVAQADIVWVTYDTPVNDDDVADISYVENQVRDIFPLIKAGAVLLISSQIPVGTTTKLEKEYRTSFPKKEIYFAYAPENLRLGRAIEVFTNPDRVVVGVSDRAACVKLLQLFEPFTKNILWMNLEAAEMVKHAINAFLATSIAFINEIAGICELNGADVKQVELGLKSDSRIGPQAYLGAGSAFSGGTLARDINVLADLQSSAPIPGRLFSAIKVSNNNHKLWAYNKLKAIFQKLAGKRIAMLGLTYKPGTNTLRRSAALEFAKLVVDEGATVAAFDPAIRSLPAETSAFVNLKNSISEVTDNCDVLYVATKWPEFEQLLPKDLGGISNHLIIIDPARHLNSAFIEEPRISYFSVGLERSRDG